MRIAYRLATIADRAFVVSSWSSSYRLADAAGMISMSDWQAVMHRQVNRVLDRADCTTVVAYDADAEDRTADLLGFIAGDPEVTWPIDPPTDLTEAPMVFYLYVKQAYRKSGIARGLFKSLRIDPNGPFVYSCKTEVVSKLADKIPEAVWQSLPVRFADRLTNKPTRTDHNGNRY